VDGVKLNVLLIVI